MAYTILQVHSISLVQFKNYRQSSFQFNARIVGICGKNGAGKTNLLDALHYLCFTKSYFGKTDAQHVLHGEGGFRIAGTFRSGATSESTEATCIFRENGRKEFSLDGRPYEKFSQHIGNFPCVFIAPDDVQIITGASEERRRFTDALLCQLDPQYLQRLMGYNKVLQQRNGYLKSLQGTAADDALLDVYDSQLVDHGNYVFEQRQVFLHRMAPLVQLLYGQIAGLQEPVHIAYESSLQQTTLARILSQNRLRDIQLQRTADGIHRDELMLTLGSQPFKSIASQGQRKSLLFALKLAEFDILKENKGFAPILLLDDVFEKLDQQRMHNLLTRVCMQNQGQVFITDTHQDRLETTLQQLGTPFQLVSLTAGS